MLTENIIIPSRDLYSLDVSIYDTDKPKAVIQVIHGMEEHRNRYDEFATFLQTKGYAVVTSDLRGHGKSAPLLSHIADSKGDKLLLEDAQVIREYIESRFPNTPIYLFAHSMGTIISRVLLQTDSNKYTKVVLSGYPNYNPATPVAICLADFIKLFKGPKGYSSLLTAASVGAFAKAIKNAKTNLDWLSYNEENINKYIQDPLCGEEFTIASYETLFKLVKKMHKSKAYKHINKELPILLISGNDDPCVGGDKGRKDSLITLINAGFSKIDVITYSEMRHEILNEKDKSNVMNDIAKFYSKK